MKLHELEIHNLLAQKELHLKFIEPITIFAGPNNTGKTTIGDAIAVAWSGTTRGVIKRDRASFARSPEGFSVKAITEIDEKLMPFTSTITQDSPSPGDREKWLASKDLVHCLTDYSAWNKMDGVKRGKLLNGLLPDHEWRGEVLPADLEMVRRERGLSAALRTVIENRRGAARMMKECGQPTEPEWSFEYKGEKIQLEQHDSTVLGDTIAGLSRTIKDANRNLMRAVHNTETGEEKVKELQELADLVPKHEKARDSATAARKPLNAAATNAAERMAEAKNTYEKATGKARIAKDASELRGKCGTCYQEISEEYASKIMDALNTCVGESNEAHSKQEDAIAQYNEVNASATRAKQDELDAGALLKDARRAAKELEEYQKQVAEAKEEGLDYVAIETEINRWSQDRKRLEAILSALQNLRHQENAYEDSKKAYKRMKRNIDDLKKWEDTIQANLQGGSQDVLAICAKHIKSLGDAFGVRMEMADDSLPKIDGIPFQLLCKSNQYLGLVAIQFALAVVSGVNFMFVDDLDRLTADRGSVLYGWFQSTVIAEGVQVVGAIARHEPKAWQKTPFQIVALGQTETVA